MELCFIFFNMQSVMFQKGDFSIAESPRGCGDAWTAMRIERLSLEHKELLYERLRRLQTCISEYSFANLYLFREAHDYEVVIDKSVFILGSTYDGMRFLMPTEDIRNIELEYLKEMICRYDVLFPIPEEWLRILPAGRFSSSFDDGDMDYVFTVEKISTYPGKKLHNKRNLLQQFMNLYAHEALPLTNDRIDDAIKVLEAWQSESGIATDETDYGPCLEALRRQEELVLCGGIYYAEGEPAGFILGEEINQDMYALHFAKGLTKFKGIYQFMFNSFAGVLHAHYKYVNFEQDLGKLPLRQAKSSYIPDLMLKKYRVRCEK